SKAKGLLMDGTVECVIGYERATDGITARPLFAYTAEETDRFIMDNTCVHNLARYLLDRKGKATAVVVKPCDARTINLLVQEKQIEKDKVFAIGVTCPGVVEVHWGEVPSEAQPRCANCFLEVPAVYDYLVTMPGERQVRSGFPDIERMEAMSHEERREFWEKQFERCIRCHACRQVCPGCYCPICFVDQLDPTWVGIRNATGENQVWHLIRAFHLAGRCIECGECQRVCPVGIPLMLLNQKLTSKVEGMFGFRPGLDPETLPPFAVFKKEELEVEQ
ncbi:MAG: 4Fe-4S dicluster domain-containing protein, partial [Dehalococcoidia bacterium]|nr:4Fe-4S dicluster domain-containing protein [Dehalococcoidia bacterium]